jgi:hypothetical protein
MPSLFETLGAVVVVGTTAASAGARNSQSLLSQIMLTAIIFVLCTATFLAFRAVWIRSHFDEPATPLQDARGYVLYIGMPMCVLAIGAGMLLLARTVIGG